jgi:lipopolysaccharide transport system ATP-binding protein
MSKSIIQVEKLSKVYTIGHQQQAQYETLRDNLGRIIRKPLDLFTGQKLDKEQLWALKDVSFDVQQGEVVGVIGRNGSGKSTLLKVLSRITEPTAGKATLRGRVASLLEVGTGFHAELTGRENIFLNGAILGMSKREIARKFDEIVAFSEVEKFLDTPVKFYSSGMFVRLAFAVAAHLEPEILIVDEVLAVGDAQFQKKSLGKMSSVAKEGRTVLFVSHNMGSVRELCGRAVVMEKGSATYFKDTEGAIGEYLNQGIDPTGGSDEISIQPEGITISEVTINDQPRATETTIFSGDPVLVSLKYSSKKIGSDLAVGVSLRSEKTGTMVAYSHSHLEEVKATLKRTGKVSVRLNLPKLSPDVYSVQLNVWLDSNHRIEDRTIGRFFIGEGPAFRSKQSFSSFPSLLLVDCDWDFS